MIDFIVIPLFVLAMLMFTKLSLQKQSSQIRRYGQIMLFIHILTTIGYYFLTRNGGGDAWGYWLAGQRLSTHQALLYMVTEKGTYFIYGFNYFISGSLNLGFFANTLIYSFFGYIGIICFYKVSLQYIKYSVPVMGIHIFPYLFFLPMLHFWASGVGKDSLLMFCIGITVYASTNITKRLPLAVLGLLLSYLIRPHITLMLVLSYGFAFVISKKQALWKRLTLSVVFLGIGVIILPAVLEFAKIGEASAESFSDFSENKVKNLSRSHTDSGVDISSYPMPLKWFTFLFRPLFFDINGIPALVASFENFFILLLTYKVLKSRPVHAFRMAPLEIKAMFIFLVLGVLAFSPTLGNLGIMIRMRNMFLPGMFLFYMYVMSIHIEYRVAK